MSETKTCPECGRAFAPSNYGHIFCSKRCAVRYREVYGAHGYEPITFTCAHCGRTVVTEGGSDKRSRFCSPECEKRYWRHPPHDREYSRQNFRSIEEYESWERRTNR